MSEKIRDKVNYPVKRFSFEDILHGRVITLIGCPMKIVKMAETETLFFRVWESEDEFESASASLPKWDRELPITQETREMYAELFSLMENSALKFLGESPDEFELQTLNIDLNNLTVSAGAKGKLRVNKFVTDAALTFEEFVQLKAQYSDLVESFEEFAWEFAKAQDEELAKFN